MVYRFWRPPGAMGSGKAYEKGLMIEEGCSDIQRRVLLIAYGVLGCRPAGRAHRAGFETARRDAAVAVPPGHRVHRLAGRRIAGGHRRGPAAEFPRVAFRMDRGRGGQGSAA